MKRKRINVKKEVPARHLNKWVVRVEIITDEFHDETIRYCDNKKQVREFIMSQPAGSICYVYKQSHNFIEAWEVVE